MTRVPQDPITGKPLPNALRDQEAIPDWQDEPTVPDFTLDEIDAHLQQRAEAGQGDDLDWTFARGPRR